MFKILCEHCEATFLAKEREVVCNVCGTSLKLEATPFTDHYIGKPKKKNNNLDESIANLEKIMRRESTKSEERVSRFNFPSIKLSQIFQLAKSAKTYAVVGLIFVVLSISLFTLNYIWVSKKNSLLAASSEEREVITSINDYLKYDLPKIDVDKASNDYQIYMNYSKLEDIKKAKSSKKESSLINGSEILIAPVSVSVVSSAYGYRIHPLKKVTEFHEGVDIPRPYGSPIKAALSGRVTYSGWKQGYGNIVIVKHENGYVTYYGHNSRNIVKVGQNVKQNETIALVGSTGNSTGPHLHFEIRKNNKLLNPSKYLKFRNKREA